MTAVFFAKIQNSKRQNKKKTTVPEPILLNWLVVEPTHLKKYARQNGFIFPNFRGEKSKKHVNQYLGYDYFTQLFRDSNKKSAPQLAKLLAKTYTLYLLFFLPAG